MVLELRALPTYIGYFITLMNKGVLVPVFGKKGSLHMLTHLSQIMRFFTFSSKQMLLQHLKYAVIVINEIAFHALKMVWLSLILL